jgi:hypothetical protein
MLNDMQTYQEVDDFVQALIARKQRDIEQIIYAWLTASRKADMMLPTESGKWIFNTPKAEKHLALVQLYDMILKNEHAFRYPGPARQVVPLPRPEPKSINPRYNAKIIREYDQQVKKNAEKSAQHLLNQQFVIQAASEKRKFIGLATSELELIADFNGNRQIVKSLFQPIFSQYGIHLQPHMLGNLFGKFTLAGKSYDSIQLFTKHSYFPFPLEHQFSVTLGGKANGIFSAFFMRAAGRLVQFGNDPRFDDEPYTAAVSKMDNNPFGAEKKVIRVLATAAACTY